MTAFFATGTSSYRRSMCVFIANGDRFFVYFRLCICGCPGVFDHHMYEINASFEQDRILEKVTSSNGGREYSRICWPTKSDLHFHSALLLWLSVLETGLIFLWQYLFIGRELYVFNQHASSQLWMYYTSHEALNNICKQVAPRAFADCRKFDLKLLTTEFVQYPL